PAPTWTVRSQIAFPGFPASERQTARCEMRYKALPVILRLRRSSTTRKSTQRTPSGPTSRLRDKIATALMLASLPISFFVVLSTLAAGPALHVSGIAHPGLHLTVGGSAFPRND